MEATGLVWIESAEVKKDEAQKENKSTEENFIELQNHLMSYCDQIYIGKQNPRMRI